MVRWQSGEPLSEAETAIAATGAVLAQVFNGAFLNRGLAGNFELQGRSAIEGAFSKLKAFLRRVQARTH
jgi:hypothetical protein